MAVKFTPIKMSIIVVPVQMFVPTRTGQLTAIRAIVSPGVIRFGVIVTAILTMVVNGRLIP